MDLKRQFAESELSYGQDPDEWMMNLDYTRNRLWGMKSMMEDDDYIGHVLSNLTSDYSELVTVLEGELDVLTLPKLRERIRGFYRRKISTQKDNLDDGEVALLHSFKGRCNNCGNYGHKARDCPTKKNMRGEKREKYNMPLLQEAGVRGVEMLQEEI